LTTKWEILAAVWASRLPVNAKAYMARQVDLADAETAFVDQRFTRSKKEMAGDLNVSPSTVADIADRLERGGWLKRDRPSTEASMMRGEKTAYQLLIGDDELPPSRNKKGSGRTTADPVREPDQSGSRTPLVREPDRGSPGAGQGVVREPDTPSPGAGHPPVRETAGGSPGAGHKSPSTHHYPSDPSRATADAAAASPALPGFEDTEQPPAPKTPKRKAAAKKAAKAADPTENQRINTLTKVYTDQVKLTSFHAVRAVVVAAVKTGDYTDAQIEAALAHLVAENMSCSHNTLRIALEGRSRAAPRGHQPYRDPEDQNVYLSGVIR
jgi:hypothetical protein